MRRQHPVICNGAASPSAWAARLAIAVSRGIVGAGIGEPAPAGAVITAGALHTQSDTAQAITGRHAGYVMTVKASTPALYEQLTKLPWTAIPATSAVSTGHGRRARRTIKAVLVPAWTGFAGAAQVAQVRRAVTRKGKKTAGVVYLITSDRSADPATLAAWVRGHWHIENKLHQASETLRRSEVSRPRCACGPRGCWAWRQRLGC